jgi:hypothetical protein
LPQSPKNLQTDIFGRYYTLTDNFTNGLNPSVFYSAYHNDRRMYRRISSSVFQTFTKNCIDGFNPSVCHTITDGINSSVYFKRETFFGVQVPYVKSSANVFFIFPTDIATKSGITDERKADGHFPLVRMPVNKLPTKP